MFSILFINNCKKEPVSVNDYSFFEKEKISTRFFNIRSNADPELKALAEDIKKQDSIKHFLSSFVRENGYPIWDRVIYQTNLENQQIVYSKSNKNLDDEAQNSGLFLIPCVDEFTNHVKSYIVAKKRSVNDYKYHIYNRDLLNKLDVADLLKQNLLATQAVIGYFEKQINGINEFEVKKPSAQVLSNIDIKLNGKKNSSSKPKNNTPKISETICQEIDRYYIDVTYDTTIGTSSTETYLVIIQQCDTYPDGDSGGGSGTGGGFDYSGESNTCACLGSGSSDPNDQFNPFFIGNPYIGINPPTSDYQLTSRDYEILNEIEQEDLEADNNIGTPCYGTGRSGNVRRPGTLEHWYIQWDYVNTHSNALREYSIPGSSSTSSGRRGYADIVNLNTNEIFEIKPVSQLSNGLAEAEVYVQKARENCPTQNGGQWNLGVNYPTKIFINPRNLISVIRAELRQPGLIIYTFEDRNTNPVTVPDPLPQDLADKLKDFMRNLVVNNFIQNPIEMNRRIIQFLGENPKIKDWIKIGAAGIIVGTLIEDILSGGIGVADDWACFVVARNMWIIADRKQ